MAMKSKGSRFERELISMLWSRGFAAIRAPASGSASYPSPDIIAGNGKRYVALEVKMRSSFPVYLTKKEVEDLIEFSNKFGAEPYIAVKIKRLGWRFLKVEQLIETKNGFKIDEFNFYQGSDFDELIGLKQQRLK
jgi:Holliday junction resolvase